MLFEVRCCVRVHTYVVAPRGNRVCTPKCFWKQRKNEQSFHAYPGAGIALVGPIMGYGQRVPDFGLRNTVCDTT